MTDATRARALLDELQLRVRLHADSLAQSLEQDLELVAWDRENLIGHLQHRLSRLAVARHVPLDEHGVRVIERRLQPLEAIDLAWLHLLQGRRVYVEHEPGACRAAIELLRMMARELDDDALQVAKHPRELPDLAPSHSGTAFRRALQDEPTLWPVVGPTRAQARWGEVQYDADRELAAYVLARASLRRSGFDPYAVKFAFVHGPIDRLQRHLVRLWVGARIGPASQPDAFAGPVSIEERDEYTSVLEAWIHHPHVEAWCTGGVLERPEPSHYVAPSLFACDWPAPDLPLAGPMLVVMRCDPAQTRTQITQRGGHGITIGPAAPPRLPDIVHVRGALLVERLPPGLPEPRPV